MSSGGEKPFTVGDAVAVVVFTRGAEAVQAAGVEAVEILHTTIRGVCPSCSGQRRAAPFNFMRVTPGSFPTAHFYDFK